MPQVDIKGVGLAQFPDDMTTDQIRAFLVKKYPSSRGMEHTQENSFDPHSQYVKDKSLP